MATAAIKNITNKLTPGSDSSKSSSKKKAGAKNLEPPSVPSEKSSALNSPRNGINADDDSGEPAHVREVAKQIRNINKKLNSMAKVDAIIAENPSASLDSLVSSRKINADQKAQALKKPQLQAQVASLEAQLNVFREIEEGYEKKSSKDKEALLAAHATEVARAKDEAKLEAEQSIKKLTRTHLLTFSRFLAAAANRRNQGDDSSDEAKAFEGALLLVYGGDTNAVDAAEKIINGSSENVTDVQGVPTTVPYSKIKELSLQDLGNDDSFDGDSSAVQSDPTITNAGLTEIDDLTTAEITNGVSKLSADEVTAPAASSIDAGASNAAADSQWDPTKPGAQEEPLAESYELVPRDPAEVDKAPRTTGNTQSWADEAAAEASYSEAAYTDMNASGAGEEAFQEVSHHRGGRRGGFRGGDRGDRGRGGRGGRGFRGDGRGRGRGRGNGDGNYRGRAPRGGEQQ